MIIIVIGCGKAGLLHRKIYKLLIKEVKVETKIYYVDRLRNPLWGEYKCNKENISEKVYESIEEVISENNLCVDDIIADICVPAGGILSVLTSCKKNGIRKCICEKPFVLYKEPQYNIYSLLEDMNIITVKNYLYSKATIKAKEFIETKKLNIISINSNFSKNRREESYQLRGFETKEEALSIWEVEVPHLIYLNNYFGDKPTKIQRLEYNDMVFSDKRLKNHGNGTLIYKTKNNITCSIYSSLESDKIIRKIDINCDRDYVLHIEYSPIPNYKDKLLSILEITRNGIVEDKIYFRDDNNLYNMLLDYLRLFETGEIKNIKNIDDIVFDSKFMENLVK